MFTLCTSEDVLDEAHRVWRRRYPEGGGMMRVKREELFRRTIDDVLSDWKGGTAPVSDPDDAHVHNAAVFANVDILLTSNAPDFPDPDQRPYDLYTPDQFFCLLHGNSPAAVQAVARDQAKYWEDQSRKVKNDRHPKSLADALTAAGCPEFSKLIEKSLQFVSGALQQSEALRAADQVG